jgi:hypothetical protein
MTFIKQIPLDWIAVMLELGMMSRWPQSDYILLELYGKSGLAQGTVKPDLMEIRRAKRAIDKRIGPIAMTMTSYLGNSLA